MVHNVLQVFTYNTRASEQQLLKVPLALSFPSEQSIFIAGNAGPVIYNRILFEIGRLDSFQMWKG